MISFVSQKEAAKIDEEFFSTLFYQENQLIELAGLSVAKAVFREFPPAKYPRVLLVCGPGNNGGDGLACARHLQYFGYTPTVCYPKPGKTETLHTLVKQLEVHEIPVLQDLPELTSFDVIVDAIFGYSFHPPVRGVFGQIIETLNRSALPVLSVDVPSGWDVEGGRPADATAINTPHACISLSAPKRCLKDYRMKHYLGGRFVPKKLLDEMHLTLPAYPEDDLIVDITQK